MNKRAVFHLVSYMTLVIGIAIVACAGVSWFYDEPMRIRLSLLESGLIAIGCAAIVGVLTRGDINLSRRDGFGVVTFGWLSATLFGSLPYIFSGVIPHPMSAIFETMSGFTTTGASVLSDLENIPRGILFWRALTHWFGGMGVLVLCVAILPFLGVGGMQIYRAEMPGPSKDRLTPRITTTAKLLWGVYALLTLVEALLLKFVGGMGWFDALCHTFATMATGGFSTYSASVGAFDSAVIDAIITVFMFLAGVNFSLHYQALRGRLHNIHRNEEFRVYLGITLFAIIALISFNFSSVYDSFADNLRYSAFQVVSIMTTTGFATADYEVWPVIGQYLLVSLMFIGGCAGSTGGGMKVARILLLFKHAHVQLFRLIHPRAIRLVKLGNIPVDREVMQAILGFFALFMGVFVVASFLMAASGMDLVSAGGSVIATLSNIGPGLGSVGPTDNYAHIAPFGKSVLMVCMLLGRLELFTVLVLIFPTFWRK